MICSYKTAIIVLIAVFIFPSLVFSDVYQWQDKDGATVFSDVPHKDAKKLNIKSQEDPNTKPVENVKENVTKPVIENKKLEETTAKLEYQHFQFSNLQNEMTIRNNNAIPYTVSFNLAPALHADDIVNLYVDGVAYGESIKGPVSSVQFVVKGIDRGMHTIQAKVFEKKTKKELIATESLTVYFQQNTVLNKAK
jgi:hypothetical protein